MSVLYRFLRAPKDMVRCFLVVVIFLPSRETPVKMRKIWDKHGDILLVLTIIALWATKKDAMLSVYIMWGSVITPHWRRVLHFADL